MNELVNRQLLLSPDRVLGPSDPCQIDKSDCYNDIGTFCLMQQSKEYIESDNWLSSR